MTSRCSDDFGAGSETKPEENSTESSKIRTSAQQAAPLLRTLRHCRVVSNFEVSR